MAKARRIDFSPGDWIGGTLELSLEEEGLYIRICSLIWSRGGRITEDLLRATTREHWSKVKAILGRLENKGKIIRNGSEIGQKRAENELERAEIRLRKAEENGAKGGRPKGLAEAAGLKTEKLTRASSSTSTTTTIEEEEDSEATPLPPDDPVKEVFERGVAMLGTVRRSLLGKFCKSHGDVAVLEAIITCETERPVDPVSFFIAAMARSPPKNGHTRQSPVTTLYEGAMRAADKLDQQEADRSSGVAHALPFLDSRRSR